MSRVRSLIAYVLYTYLFLRGYPNAIDRQSGEGFSKEKERKRTSCFPLTALIYHWRLWLTAPEVWHQKGKAMGAEPQHSPSPFRMALFDCLPPISQIPPCD